MIDDGGYSAASRVRFGIAALLAAVAATAADPARARAIARSPALLVLLALGLLGAVSAAWTVGLAGDAVRWGVVTAAYAAVAFAGAILIRDRRGTALAAGLIAVLAVAMGVVGLVAAARTHVPLAHREAGLWRPAATFQYSPALALLIVSALPPLLAAMTRARRAPAAVLGAFGGAIAGASLALAASRTQLAFAVVVCGAALAVSPGRRAPLATAVALIAAAGLGAYAVAGGYVPLTPPPDGDARLLALGAVVLGAAFAWPLARAALGRGVPSAALVAVLLAVGGAGAIVKPAPRLISSGFAAPPSHRAPPRPTPAKRPHAIRDQLLHGRLGIWRDALETFADRPLQGGGADSYLFASSRHQGPRSVLFAHDLPLELAAELGVAGLLLALALYAGVTRALWRGRGADTWLLWPAAAAFPAANLVDWPWHLAGSGAVWALAFGAILGPAGATRGGG